MTKATSTAIVARNTTYQFVGKAIAMLLSMVLLAIIARYLSEEEYGLYTMISTIFVAIVGFTELKVEQVAIRKISEDESKLHYIANQLAAAKVIFSVVVVLLALIIINVSNLPSIVKLGASIVSIGAVINALQAGFYTAIQYRLKVYLFTLAEVISKVVTTLLIVLVAWSGYSFISGGTSLLSFSIISLLIPTTIILICFAYWAIRGLGVKVSFHFNWAFIRRLTTESWPLWFMGVLAILQVRLATFMMIGLQDAEAVGMFGLAYRFLDVAVTLPPLFTASIFPLLTRYAMTDPERAKSIVQKSFDFLAIFIAIVAVITVYASPQIVELFGGADKYAGSVGVLRILTGSMVAMYLAGVLGPYLVSVHGQRFAVYAVTAGVVVNVLLGIWLIPHYSFNGAAIAVSVSEFVILAILLWAVSTKYGFNPRITTALKAGIAAIITWIVLWFSGINQYDSSSIFETFANLVIIGVIGGVVYGLLVWWWKIIPADILEQALSMLPIPNKIKRAIRG